LASDVEAVVRDRRWEQWAPLSGLVFIVLFIIGILLFATPDSDNPADRILSFYDDKGHRTQNIVSGYLLTLAGVFFYWFLASLRVTLSRIEGVPARLTSIVYGSGLVFIAMLMSAAVCFSFVSGEITFADTAVSPELARVLPDMGWGFLLLGGAFSAIAMIDAASVLIVRTGVFPRWVGWLGFVVALGLLVSFLVFPIALLLIWIGVVSLALLAANGVPVPGLSGSREALPGPPD
jgi:hypothetical protein